MDDRRIVLGLTVDADQLPSIKVVNRWTLKVECVLTGSVQEKMKQLQLYGDMICCSYNDGTITIWDIKTRQIVQQIQDQIVENREFARKNDRQISFHAAHGLFVSCISFIAPDGIHKSHMNFDTHITVRRILSLRDMVVENTQVIPYSLVMQLESIPNYFVIFFRKFPYNGKLQLRSKVDFQIFREVETSCYMNFMFCYSSGRLLTIELTQFAEVSLKFWDPETLDHIFESPFDFLPADEVYLTTYNLIIRSIDGVVKVYDLPSLNNGKSCCEQYSFLLKKGERQWAQSGFTRMFGLISSCLDDLQIVTIASSQAASKLVVRDFIKS